MTQEWSQESSEGGDATTGLTFRALNRLAASLSASASETADAAGARGEGQEGVSVVQRAHLREVRRQQRLAAQAAAKAARWRVVRHDVLEALRDLRAQEEGGFLQAVDPTRAALFQVPSLSEVPPEPTWWDRSAKRPDPEDASEEAEAWRAQRRMRVEALHLRHEYSLARRLVPYNCWRQMSLGERGGLIPGQRAYPAGWNSYLLRIDGEGVGGDGWNSAVGLAFRRLERRVGHETPWLRSVWLYTEPRRPEWAMARVREGLGVRKSQAYAWLNVGALWLVAEMTTVVAGRGHARGDVRAAEDAEARAWERDAVK